MPASPSIPFVFSFTHFSTASASTIFRIFSLVAFLSTCPSVSTGFDCSSQACSMNSLTRFGTISFFSRSVTFFSTASAGLLLKKPCALFLSSGSMDSLYLSISPFTASIQSTAPLSMSCTSFFSSSVPFCWIYARKASFPCLSYDFSLYSYTGSMAFPCSSRYAAITASCPASSFTTSFSVFLVLSSTPMLRSTE